MANLVQTTDFVNEIALPQDPAGVKTKKICKFIDQYEPEFYQYALGNALTESFLAGVTANTQIWEDLRDGVVYEVNGKSIKFGGILPLIRRYVYYYYTRNEISTTTLVGEKKEAAANSTDFTMDKSIQQWNKMSRDICKMWDFLNERVDDSGDKVYTEFDSCVIDFNHFKPINWANI